jgi:uncharacterized protein (DUF1697 family)
MTRYVAFLRGINVGGHKKVSMSELKKVFERQGFQDVKTLLASGNVVFHGEEELTRNISGNLEKALGFATQTTVLPFEVIEAIVKSDPFKAVRVTPQIRLYVTFLKEEPKTGLKIPYASDDESFRIIGLTDKAIFSVVDLEKTGTADAMNMLEKEFGKSITTRNYNTIVRIAKL